MACGRLAREEPCTATSNRNIGCVRWLQSCRIGQGEYRLLGRRAGGQTSRVSGTVCGGWRQLTCRSVGDMPQGYNRFCSERRCETVLLSICRPLNCHNLRIRAALAPPLAARRPSRDYVLVFTFRMGAVRRFRDADSATTTSFSPPVCP